MSSYRQSAPATILGGLPVHATVAYSTGQWGYDDDWCEVESIRWLKRDGTPGKEIPSSVRDRAEAFDPMLCQLMEQVSEHCAMEREEARLREMA